MLRSLAGGANLIDFDQFAILDGRSLPQPNLLRDFIHFCLELIQILLHEHGRIGLIRIVLPHLRELLLHRVVLILKFHLGVFGLGHLLPVLLFGDGGLPHELLHGEVGGVGQGLLTQDVLLGEGDVVPALGVEQGGLFGGAGGGGGGVLGGGLLHKYGCV